MPLSFYCSASFSKTYGRKRLVLAGHQKPVLEQAGSSRQGALRCPPCQFRKIIAFREMRKNHVGRLTVVTAREEVGCRLIRKVPNPGKNPLLDGPGIGSVAQHCQIVVRLQKQQIQPPELRLDIRGYVAKISHKGHAYALG